MRPASPERSPQAAAPSAEDTRWYLEEVQPHGSSLRAYLRRQFPWLLEVEDIAQEALFRLWRRRRDPLASEVRSAKAALFAIARNAAFDIGRRRAVADIEYVAEIERLSVLDESASVGEDVCTRQELELLAAAVRRLPGRCRTVLLLNKMHGYTQIEIADRLGISEHTVRAHVAKGIRRCAEYLRRRGVDRDRNGDR